MISKEHLNEWLSTGYSSQALAGTGVSIETVNQLIADGLLRPQSSKTDKCLLPYQKKLFKKGSYLYYAKPFIYNIDNINPDFGRDIRSNFGSDSDSLWGYSLDYDKCINSLKYYAFMASIECCLFKETDIKMHFYEIIMLTNLLFPDLMQRYKKDEFIQHSLDDVGFHDFKASGCRFSNSTFSMQELRAILAGAISRRGAIVYYNSNIFRHQVITGKESETEIMILTQTPLTFESISGIELLSSADANALISTESVQVPEFSQNKNII